MPVFATSISKTKTNKESNPEALEEFELQRILCMHYPSYFNRFLIETLIDLDSKINVIQWSFAKKLGLCICKTDVGAQKIDSSGLKNFGMIITLF